MLLFQGTKCLGQEPLSQQDPVPGGCIDVATSRTQKLHTLTLMPRSHQLRREEQSTGQGGRCACSM